VAEWVTWPAGAERRVPRNRWMPVHGAARAGTPHRASRLPAGGSRLPAPGSHLVGRDPLAAAPAIEIAQIAHEPFLALPRSAGALRDYWLATAERQGTPARMGAQVAGADETFEAVTNGLGIVLLSAGNAEISRRKGIVTVPVRDLSPSRLAVVWRRGERRGVVGYFLEACRPAGP
jgi:LysR substrate binding domain